ncbi:hypothetical protein NG796_16570 [Laspinema sp. A4]|uniref:hypothetical protein n=1 Tax=Laspinema sp. D2d TaxID=2953686 RepID=UPI0021BB3A17|nr:hypothetical protein [Laspinema sp. D2d]MCT7984886.1 hypothetical protein [Laspinema sp. D2d]
MNRNEHKVTGYSGWGIRKGRRYSLVNRDRPPHHRKQTNGNPFWMKWSEIASRVHDLWIKTGIEGLIPQI